jgi:hypothetical protein
MILEKSKTASVPALLEFGKNETSSQSLVWRFTQRNGTRTRIRVCSLLGEFSVWQEGGSERELFRINLGVLSEVCSRARQALFKMKMALPKLRELTLDEEREVWKHCAADRELRFLRSTRMQPGKLGGWRKCLDKSAELLAGLGKEIPWDEDASFLAKEE